MHNKIEKKFKKIGNETIRLYRVDNDSVYIEDSLSSMSVKDIISNTVKNYTFSFREDNRVFVSLFYADNQGDFVILVSGIDEKGEEHAGQLSKMLALFALIGLFLHIVLTNILAKKTFKPFKELIKQVNSIKGDDWHTRLNYKNEGDEVNEFINEFNYLLNRLESSFNIQRDFLKNTSHEIKTPLAIIIGDIEVSLNSNRTPDEYRALLKSLKTNGLHLKSIVESLLTLSNLEVNNIRLKEKIRADQIIWDIIDRKKIEYSKRQIDVSFLPNVQKHSDALAVKCDSHLLSIAISNVLDNALKFSGEAKVKITFNIVDQQLEMQIIDLGDTIPLAEMENIFKLYYRNTQNSAIPGHGIGLYLTKQILDLHGIKITVEPNLPIGNIFILIFPRFEDNL